MATSGLQHRLVGREAELAELAELLAIRGADLSRPVGQPDVVLLSGDAGVGKTRLLTELRDIAFAEGWQVVAGHCLDFGDSALPYLPFSEVMGRLAADLPGVVDDVAAVHPGLARLQPGRRMISGDSGEGTVDRQHIFEAVVALLESAAVKAPLLLVIEDVHWADQSTRDLISFLISRPFTNRVAGVLSYRGEDLHRRHPLRRQVAEWSRVRGVERLQLPPLAPAAVREMIRALHPDEITEAGLADIIDRAEGNAFFVEELVGATWASQVPEDLADLLLVRLDGLDEAARQVVRAISAAGRRVSHELLAEASGVPESELDAALRSAVDNHVLITESGDSYAFRHALLAEAVHDDLLPGERVRLHAAYAAALREGRARGTAAELARHARAAMDLPTALRASIDAGDEAMAVGGPDEAAIHYEHALELVAEPKLAEGVAVTDLVIKTSDALLARGEPLRSLALLERHLATLPADEDPGAAAMLHLVAAYVGSLFDIDSDPQGHAETGFGLIPSEPTRERAKMLALYARVVAHSDKERAREAAMEALALTETHGLPKTASEVTTTLVGLDKGRPIEEFSAALEEAVARAAQTGAVGAELRALYFLGRAYQDRAEFTQACEAFARATERARAVGMQWAPYAFDARLHHAQIAYWAGKWETVLSLTEMGGQSPPPLAEAVLLSLRLAVESGRGNSVGRQLKRLRKHWSDDGVLAILSAPVEIEAFGRSAKPDQALAVHDLVIDTLTPSWPDNFQARLRLSAVTVSAFANAAGSASQEERIRLVAAAERLVEVGHRIHHGQVESGVYWGPEGWAWAARLDAEMLRLRWLAGVEAPDLSSLITAWTETVTLFEEFGHVHELAWCRAHLAAVLRAAGQLQEARPVGDLARRAAEELGAAPLLDVLGSLGNAPVRVETSAAAALTPRELEVLALVAQGRTNGAIGKQLFISTKTVSVHVSNMLGKLDASSRTEAAAIARRDGLVD
ncbi:DNA-binding CsgD family transcriptional regulator/tetratricopeptide (TPR) repeat protein [Nocardioides daedukensis]|uniref:DNA-binding CsgD family transcriptional regulator/tetratricopeptide (TPR) repeat protein n=1 Tax=Nocardioides daedukensis TaxID=634462 RepID=A0A7Y9S312_9ACTN|nr:DNA-binding CsgD family transcriptional regulator/tetratricopeptide (TPR) repeat protein [Nocardioides daedukensis]